MLGVLVMETSSQKSVQTQQATINEFAEAADRRPYRPELKPQGMLVSLCWRQEVQDQGWKRLVFPEAPGEYGPDGIISLLRLHYSDHQKSLSHVLHTLR